MVKGKKWPSLNDGDVFKIPLGDGRATVGQVVSKYLSAYYVVIFDFVAPEDDIHLHITEALQAQPVFGGLTFDALFRPGRWQILGNSAVDGRKFLPAYKVGWRVPGQYVVEDFRGTRRRPATELEKEILPNRKTMSPAIFNDAIRAHAGLEPWVEYFDDLRLGEFVKSADLFDD